MSTKHHIGDEDIADIVNYEYPRNPARVQAQNSRLERAFEAARPVFHSAGDKW